MPGLDGVQILLILERQGYQIRRGHAPGDFHISPPEQLTDLQKGVLVWHVDKIVEAIHRSLALWPCPACGSLAWRSPDAPAVACHWVCGTCVSWGMIHEEKPHALVWQMPGTVH
jgi:predicted RNA-binding Zn-ribbon protein involved in translation (DUF1610 family)